LLLVGIGLIDLTALVGCQKMGKATGEATQEVQESAQDFKQGYEEGKKAD
jgi:hypothetical protein